VERRNGAGERVDNLTVSIRSVLVVGAGVAGSTLAYWLARHGMETTVVERAGAQRSSGSPVDVRGPALAVVERMNLLAPLREAATLATNLTVVDSRGRRIGWIPTQPSGGGLEIPRSELPP
jgi:2-polyprenyl-6-methoxyphenol hydroxylase-like FAD-dependent oxidoreductase